MADRIKSRRNSIKSVFLPPAELTPLLATQKTKFYGGLWLSLNAALWGGALLYLFVKPPSYTSKWAINVPVPGNVTNVDVPGIGKAYSSADSPYHAFADPREIYRYLMQSKEVAQIAAKQANIPVEQFGEPRTKIVDNTTLMEFEIKGKSPEQAQQKAIALQKALESKLTQLKAAEQTERDRTLSSALKSDEERLRSAEDRLTDFRENSSLSSASQLENLTSNLETLRRSRSEAVAEMQQYNSKFSQLAGNLGLSAQEAADVLALQSDQLFQRYLSSYSQASGEISALSARYGADSPNIQAKKRERAAAEAALLRQAESLLKRPISAGAIQRWSLSKGSSANATSEQANLFKELVTLRIDREGLEARVRGFDQQIAQLENRLARMTKEGSKLENFQRDIKLAEAIVSGNSGRLHLSQSAMSSSYPSMTIATAPNLPKERNVPPLLVLLGATVGSVFVTTGIVSLWRRDSRRHRNLAR
jgi:uncharacterized protein involved in exopolysaccharide biosynthesis